MEALKAAVIGCGVIGPTHAASFSQLEGVDLKYACDLVPERAEKLAAEYGASAVTDYRQVLDDPNVTLVSIGTPHPQHPDIFVDAVQAGKAVICEKPLGVKPAQLDAMLAAAAASDRPSAGVFQHRFSFTVRHLKKLLDDGAFGTLQSGSLWFRCRRGPEYYEADAWRGTQDGEGGGVFINQAIHFIDLVTFLLGAPMTIAGTVEHRWVPGIEVEDAGEATVTYPGDVTVSFDVANVPDGNWDTRLEVIGSAGRFVIDSNHRILEIAGVDASVADELAQLEARERAQKPLPGKTCYGPLHVVQFHDFLECVRNAHSPHVTVADAAETNRLILGLYQSSETGKTVQLHAEDGTPLLVG